MAATTIRPGTPSKPPKITVPPKNSVPKAVASVTTPKLTGPTKIGQVGMPGGKLPSNPTDGMYHKGSGGVNWKYSIAEGGWVRVPTMPTTVTTQSRPAATGMPTPSALNNPSAPTTTTVTTPGTPPNAAWWQGQYTSDPSFRLTDPVLRAAQNQTSTNYGYTINRDVTEGSPTKGQAYYRAPKIDPVTKKPVLDETGKPVYLATGILQTFDDAGKPVYKDSTGKVYAPADLEMEINRIAKGQEGYLEGALGAAEATSEKNQFGIGDVAARAGVRRSGMRGQASAAETGALQSALAGLTGKAAGELTGIDKQYADLYSSIFKTLAPKAEALAAPTTTEVPVVAPAPAAAPEQPHAPAPDAGPSDNNASPDIPKASSGATFKVEGIPGPSAVNQQRTASALARIPAAKRTVGAVVYKWRPPGKSYNVEAVITSVNPFVITYRKANSSVLGAGI